MCAVSIAFCETPSRALLKELFEKSSLRIFKNFEKGDNLRRLFNFTARAYPYRRDYKDKIRVGAVSFT